MNLSARTLDVCADAGELRVARLSLDGTTLDYGPVDLTQPRLWSRAVPPNLKDLRVRDGLVTATQGAMSGPDHAFRITATEMTDLGVCYGVWATAMCVLNGHLKILVVRDPFHVEWLQDNGESLETDPIGIDGGTALGILQAFDGSDVIAWAQSGDGYATKTIHGVTLTLPRTDGSIWTGQSGGQTLAVLPDGTVQVVAPYEGHDIRIASIPGQTAIASWAPTEDGGSFLVVAPPWPVVPPVPMPDVSLVTPARKDFRLGSYLFAQGDGQPFGSFTMPIRLSTMPPGDIINAGADNGHPISFFAGEDGSQTFAEAVAKQRPLADAAGVGLSLYVDRVPFTPEDLARYRPGDVLMPQVNAITALEPAKLLIAAGYPVCLSLGLQQQAPDVCAHLIIEAAKVQCFGAVIFAKDRADVPWAAFQPYLDRWNSGVESPAKWPEPETPMPALPVTCFAMLHNANFATVNPATPTVVELAHQPNVAGAWQQVEVAASKVIPNAVTIRFIEANSFFRVDRVLTRDQKYDQAVQAYPVASPNADSAWQVGTLNGAFVHYLSEPVNGHQGTAYTVTLVDADGKLINVGSGSTAPKVAISGVNFTEAEQ